MSEKRPIRTEVATNGEAADAVPASELPKQKLKNAYGKRDGSCTLQSLT